MRSGVLKQFKPSSPAAQLTCSRVLMSGMSRQFFAENGQNDHVKLKVDVLPGASDRHVIFLHGLFGKGQSF